MKNRYIELMSCLSFLVAFGCAGGEKPYNQDDPSLIPCKSEWEATCAGGGTQMEDRTCGQPPIPLMECQNGCVMGSCLAPDEDPPLEAPTCTPHWQPKCAGAGVVLMEMNCGQEPKVITEDCEAGCDEGICLQPEAGSDSGTETGADEADGSGEGGMDGGSSDGGTDTETTPEPEHQCIDDVWSEVQGDQITPVESCTYRCDPATGCVPDPCPEKKAYVACHESNRWWYDGCNTPHSLEQVCEDGCNGDTCVELPNVLTNVMTVMPAPLLKICPEHIGGDREFKGHGPIVDVYVELQVDGPRLLARTIVHALETQADYTEGYVEEIRELWRAPNGCVIDGPLGPEASSISYVDADHGLDAFQLPEGSLVNRIEANGDSKGSDLDNCADSKDTWVNVIFNPIRVQVTCTSAPPT